MDRTRLVANHASSLYAKQSESASPRLRSENPSISQSIQLFLQVSVSFLDQCYRHSCIAKLMIKLRLHDEVTHTSLFCADVLNVGTAGLFCTACLWSQSTAVRLFPLDMYIVLRVLSHPQVFIFGRKIGKRYSDLLKHTQTNMEI